MNTTWYFADKLDAFKAQHPFTDDTLIQAAYWEGVKQVILLTQRPEEDYPRWTELEKKLDDTFNWLTHHQFTPMPV